MDSAVAATVKAIVEEGPISMRDAAAIYGSGVHKATPTRHATKGVKRPGGAVLKLESFRMAGRLCTSRPAVLRFLTALNEPGEIQSDVALTPAVRKRRASKASAAVADLLGAA